MKKVFKRGFILSIMIMTFMIAINVFAATIGDTLIIPEEGWKRINDSDTRITFSGSIHTLKDAKQYQGDYIAISNVGSSMKFKFLGSKLRLYSWGHEGGRSINIPIKVDGIEYRFSQTSAGYQKIRFELLNLDFKMHNVEIIIDELTSTSPINGKIFELDSMDIDSDGEIFPYDYANLIATASTTNAAISLNWDKINDATSYIIKRSTMQGGSYTTIQKDVIQTSYIDTNVSPNTTYYYVIVPVINGGEGTQSNEASAKLEVELPPIQTGNAVLIISMTNGQIKSYSVDMTTVNNFISWYNNRAAGTNGNPYFIFDKKDNLQPFTKKMEYLVFDKISSFEVDEYTK